MTEAPRALTVLIAAMGGEGGGVLADWIVAAAAAEGLPVQGTSIPGVAQRTGATTYYLEIHPRPQAGRRPVAALAPGIGNLDVVLASELMEAARVVGNGVTDPARTVLVASTHRVYAMAEKTAMGDGRHDPERLLRCVAEGGRKAVLFDMEAAARDAGGALNAVLLGALAGAACLPIAAERFEQAIRATGKAVEGNLRGFRLGRAVARGEIAIAPLGLGKRPWPASAVLQPLLARSRAELPAATAELAVEGLKRVAGWQDPAYAQLYLDRLLRIAGIERSLGGAGALSRETARQLALWMSYEDVPRVAQLKADPARLERIRREVGAGPDQPLAVVDLFKPGLDEIAALLPPGLAGRLMGWRWRPQPTLRIDSASISGHLLVRLVAGLRRWRRHGQRFQAEQVAIAAWLERVAAAARLSEPLALEIVACAGLLKGYGDTLTRGRSNHARITSRLVEPALAGRLPPDFAADAIASARAAALADPEGRSLEHTLGEIQARGESLHVAAE